MSSVRGRVFREKNVPLQPDVHKRLKILALQGDSEIKRIADVILRFVLESDERVSECMRRIGS